MMSIFARRFNDDMYAHGSNATRVLFFIWGHFQDRLVHFGGFDEAWHGSRRNFNTLGRLTSVRDDIYYC
jgi:hypothetical protein